MTNPPVHLLRQVAGAPADSCVFVSGMAYEVFLIGDAAVIERHGLPHKVEFAPGERRIIIDGGEPITLKFGETKLVWIDDQQHSIRFGQPSQELYLGDRPFRAFFGGPPIGVGISGVHHFFQLLGPVPDVVIHDDPSHELVRFVPANRPLGMTPALPLQGAMIDEPVYRQPKPTIEEREAAYELARQRIFGDNYEPEDLTEDDDEAVPHLTDENMQETDEVSYDSSSDDSSSGSEDGDDGIATGKFQLQDDPMGGGGDLK